MSKLSILSPAVVAGLLLAPLPSLPRAGTEAEPASTGRPLKISVSATGEAGPGSVILDVAPPEAGDPQGTIRLQAVLQGPLQGEGSEDIYAFSAILRFPGARLTFLKNSLRKGDLLGRDGRNTLITAGVADDRRDSVVTIGATRLGAVPGLAAPADTAILFSAAFRVLAPGEVTLSWEDSSFIDSNVRAVGGARFVNATLRVEEEEERPSSTNAER